MGNIAPPKVILELDKKRTWQFDMNAMLALHDALGDDALQQLQSISPPKEDGGPASMKFDAKTFKVMRALLWCGLVSDDPQLTLQHVGSFASVRTAVDVLIPALEALNEALAGPSTAQDVVVLRPQ